MHCPEACLGVHNSFGSISYSRLHTHSFSGILFISTDKISQIIVTHYSGTHALTYKHPEVKGVTGWFRRQLCLKLKLCQLMDNELSHILQYLPSFLIWAFLFVFIYKSSYFSWICCHKRHQIDHLQYLNCIMLHHFISVHFMLQESMVQLRHIQLFLLIYIIGSAQ